MVKSDNNIHRCMVREQWEVLNMLLTAHYYCSAQPYHGMICRRIMEHDAVQFDMVYEYIMIEIS